MDGMRLLIVDDHPIIEEGLLFFLEKYPDIEVVATAKDGLEGLDRLRRFDPDLVLLDLGMPKLDGVEAIRLYLGEKPDLGIVVFTGQKSDVYIYQALEAGAQGYVLKGCPVTQVVEALRAVQCGRYWVSPELSDVVISSYLRRGPRELDVLADFKALTRREQQVFRLLAKGKSTREIGEFLHISPKTVAKHRVGVKKKLDLKNPAEMAQYAAKIRLTDIEIE